MGINNVFGCNVDEYIESAGEAEVVVGEWDKRMRVNLVTILIGILGI